MFNEIASVIIHRPIEDVYDFMSQPKNRLVYDPDLIDVRHSPDGPLKIGSEIVETRGMMGMKNDMVTIVAALEPNRLISYRAREGDPVSAFGHYQFESVPEGTQLTLNFTLAPKGFMKIAVPLWSGWLKKNIAKGLQNIKKVLEKNN
jgi:uncharacterized membrane protein